MKIKNSSKIIFLSLIILSVLILLFIYIYPKNITAESIAIPKYQSGDTVNVSLSLSEKRYIFKPTQIIGTIIFNGIEYESIASFGAGYDIYNSNSFGKNIQLKLQGFRYNLFVRSDLKGQQTELLNDIITIENLTDTEITISKSDNASDINILYTIALVS